MYHIFDVSSKEASWRGRQRPKLNNIWFSFACCSIFFLYNHVHEKSIAVKLNCKRNRLQIGTWNCSRQWSKCSPLDQKMQLITRSRACFLLLEIPLRVSSVPRYKVWELEISPPLHLLFIINFKINNLKLPGMFNCLISYITKQTNCFNRIYYPWTL